MQTFCDGNTVYKFIEKILTEVEYCKKYMKKHFKKEPVMSKKDEKN